MKQQKNTPSADLGKPAEAAAGYPGSKGAAGLAERIIRQMPPHVDYIEAFAGHAAVFRKKRPAQSAMLIDACPRACEWLRTATADRPAVDVICDDVLVSLETYRWSIKPSTLIYLDPPYLRSTRTRLIYDFEFHDVESHTKLLDLVLKLPGMVMISGYESALYKKLLKKWRVVKIPAMTRGGKREEWLWCNFAEPTLLHDDRFAGAGYRERENIKRKKNRWAKKFAKMDRRERQAVAAALAMVDPLAAELALRSAPSS